MTNLFFLIIFVPILALVLLALNVLLAVYRPNESKVSAFECGMNAILGQTRSTFNIQFYIVAMLFLIFDLEVVLLLPMAPSLYQISTFGFAIAIVFFIILTIGFILELGSGAIKILTSQNDINLPNPNINKKNNNK